MNMECRIEVIEHHANSNVWLCVPSFCNTVLYVLNMLLTISVSKLGRGGQFYSDSPES